MKYKLIIVVLLSLLVSGAWLSLSASTMTKLLIVNKALGLPEQQKQPSNHWLQDADSDADRFKKLEVYLRGFDQPMWEVGERYQDLYNAINDNNSELASYHWSKIKRTINNGLMKRPKRTVNAQLMFLNNVWPKMEASLNSKNLSEIKETFMVVRQACMSCHLAEKVEFMNNQPLFRDLKFND